jgi:hypothetical protein
MSGHYPNRARLTVPRAWLAAVLLGYGTGCSGGTEPSTTPLDLRVDPGATATVWGVVRAAPTGGVPYNQRSSTFDQPVAGVVVELGRWEGSGIDFYRGLPTAPDPNGWMRLRVFARTRTDARGQYRFAKVPRYEVVSVLVEGSSPLHYQKLGRYEAVHMESIFWLAHTPERREDLLVWDQAH